MSLLLKARQPTKKMVCHDKTYQTIDSHKTNLKTGIFPADYFHQISRQRMLKYNVISMHLRRKIEIK